MELESSGFTVFDVIVFVVIAVSAIMSLSRGLARETSSILSFGVGIVAAYVMLLLFRTPVRAVAPEGWPEMAGDAGLVVAGFLVAYLLAAGLGGQLARWIHTSPEIGSLDRLAGAAFGAARGALAVVLFVLLMHMVIPVDSTPPFIAKSKAYPVANGAATWLYENIPGFMQRAQDAIPPLDDPAADNSA